MKEYTIYDIEALTENDAAVLAQEKLDSKGHTVYLVDFQGYFGYSCLVFKNRHHLRHANDYELHHKGKTHDQLRGLYLDKLTKNFLHQMKLLPHYRIIWTMSADSVICGIFTDCKRIAFLFSMLAAQSRRWRKEKRRSPK